MSLKTHIISGQTSAEVMALHQNRRLPVQILGLGWAYRSKLVTRVSASDLRDEIRIERNDLHRVVPLLGGKKF